MKILSVDAGGTFIKFAWMNEEGTILEQEKVPTPYGTKEDFMNVIKEIWNQENEEKVGICISLPGTINTETGFVHQGGSLHYHNQFNLKETYEKEFNTRVEVDNDARCAALAEMEAGNMKDIQNGIVLTFGTGVGGCFIINGEIYKGTHLFSGEVSMLICKDIKKHKMDGVFGHIGGVGHFIQRVCHAKHCDLVDGKTVYEWIEKKDETALSVFKAYCYDIVVQLFNMQIMLDPQRVCLGGGVSENPIFINGIKKAMNAFYDSLPVSMPRLELMSCKYHNNANLIGAFYHFKRQVSK